MGKRKQKMAFIQDENERVGCFKKSSRALLKKIQELSILCGVEACCIVYSPDDNAKAAAWPPSFQETIHVVSRFTNVCAEERSRKMLNHENYAKGMINKLQEQVLKMKDENRQKEVKLVLGQLMSGESREMEKFDAADLEDIIRASAQWLHEICDEESRRRRRRRRRNVEVSNVVTMVDSEVRNRRRDILKFDLNEPPEA